MGQFATCALLSLAVALVHEPAPFAGLVPAALPILYGGLLSIGVAYTLQIVAQQTAHPAHASIILSMEALFAAIEAQAAQLGAGRVTLEVRKDNEAARALYAALGYGAGDAPMEFWGKALDS